MHSTFRIASAPWRNVDKMTSFTSLQRSCTRQSADTVMLRLQVLSSQHSGTFRNSLDGAISPKHTHIPCMHLTCHKLNDLHTLWQFTNAKLLVNVSQKNATKHLSHDMPWCFKWNRNHVWDQILRRRFGVTSSSGWMLGYTNTASKNPCKWAQNKAMASWKLPTSANIWDRPIPSYTLEIDSETTCQELQIKSQSASVSEQKPLHSIKHILHLYYIDPWCSWCSCFQCICLQHLHF